MELQQKQHFSKFLKIKLHLIIDDNKLNKINLLLEPNFNKRFV